MSKNIATNISYVVLVAFAGYYYFLSDNIRGLNQGGQLLGPGGFPKILAIILILLCVIGFIQQKVKSKADEKIDFSGLGLVFITMGLIILYFISWRLLGYFYIITFIFIFSLMTLFSLRAKTPVKKALYINLPVTGGLLVIIYLLFDLLLLTRF